MISIVDVKQNNTYKVTFRLVDENDDAISLTELTSMYLTLYYYNTDKTTSDKYHLATINGRFNQDVKNNNDVTITATCHVTWYMEPDDNAKLNSNLEEEAHIALFTWVWDSGKRNSLPIYFKVGKQPYAI